MRGALWDFSGVIWYSLHFTTSRGATPHYGSASPALKSQIGIRQAILCLSIGIVDCGLRLLKLGLTQLDDRTKSELIARLSKTQSQVGLLQQLICHSHTLQFGIRGKPGGTYVAHNLIAQIARALRLSVGFQSSLGGLREVAESIKDRERSH